jgi:hypothetical protein
MKKPEFRLYRFDGREVPTAWFYIRNILIGLLIIGLIILYSLEFSYFGNTFGFRDLLWKALLLGGLLGLLLGYLFQRKIVQPLEKVQILIFFTLLCLIFMPLFASLSNRLLHFGKTEVQKYPLFHLKSFISDRFGLIKGDDMSPDGYYLYILKDEQIVRITTRDPRFEQLERGDTVRLKIRKGLWGYEWYAGK